MVELKTVASTMSRREYPSLNRVAVVILRLCKPSQHSLPFSSTVADSQSPLIFETKYLDGDNNPEVYLRLEYISLDANDKICMSQLFNIDEIRF